MTYSTLTALLLVGIFSLLGSFVKRASACPASYGTLFDQHSFGYTVDPLHDFYSHVPYREGWSSWWHPSRVASEVTPGAKSKGLPVQDGGRHASDWNLLYHLGGNGPWVQKVDDVVEGGIEVPAGCTVDQVHMMSRHAERYPTMKAGRRMLKLMKHIEDSKVGFKGDLAFLNTWEYFSSDPKHDHEHLTRTGPYAGTLGAFTTGVKLRTRYSHLLDQLPADSITNLWACGCNRVISTARYFSAGFFGLSPTSQPAFNLNVIPEDPARGANTLTPGDTCKRYLSDHTHGHDSGYGKLHAFRATYLSRIRARLHKQNPKIEFNDEQIYAMQELCGFETTIRGSSLWCDVFTREDWLDFEYARDIIHFYRSGPGTPYGAPMGWLWLNATVDLMTQGSDVGTMFFSFVHDGDIIPLISALKLFHDEDLLITQRPKHYNFHTSTITPMGGRVILERMSCEKARKAGKREYVRININDGVVPFPGCESGPGRSCPLDEFVEWTAKRGEELGEYGQVCGLDRNAPRRIDFLHQ